MKPCFDKFPDARRGVRRWVLLFVLGFAGTGGAAEPTLLPEEGPIRQMTCPFGKTLTENIAIATRRIDSFAEVQGLVYGGGNQVMAFSIRKAAEGTGRVIVTQVKDHDSSPEIVMREFDISGELCKAIAAVWFEELKKTGYAGPPKSNWRDDLFYHLAGYVNDQFYSGYFNGGDAEGNRLARIVEFFARIGETCELPKVDAGIEAKWKAALREGK